MRIFPSSILVPLLLRCTSTGVVSQRTCDNPQLGEKCNTCEPGSDTWTSDCTLMVRMKCTYIDKLTGKEESCFPPGDTINNNTPEPTWKYTQDECERGGTNLEFEATIVYEMCNRNTDAFTPIATKNFIKFAHNRRLEEESIIEADDWDNTIPAEQCRTQIEKRTLKPCKNKWRGMALEMDGDLSRPWPKYCRCFLREYLLSEISANPQTPAPIPDVKDTPAPVPAPRKTPAPVPDVVGITPAPIPEPVKCDFTDVVITELASPELSYAKYIELLFMDNNCDGVTINVDLSVISYGPGDCEPSSLVINLRGETIRDDGFLTICNSKQTQLYYGRGQCTVIGGLTSPANLRGTETIAIVEGGNNDDDKVIDIFGIPCTDANADNNQYFVNGRVVRRPHVWVPISEYDHGNFYIFPGCGQEVGPEAMDVNEWRNIQGPICAPKATILITEIIDLDVDSLSQVPRYVELYAPRKRHRGTAFDHDLKLVIFHSDNKNPHWESAVPIDYMPESGFLLICNKAALRSYGDDCVVTSHDIAGPANSNGNDQIALVSGDESGWFVVDIYGVIGEDGSDTDHDFFNSRVIRKLDVRETRATWSRHEWEMCKSDIPDPNNWDNDTCGGAEGAPSDFPSSAPSPISQKDCEFFFTELADYENKPFIEIKSTCPGAKISRDISVVSWKEFGFTSDVNLKGVTVPDDGFIIICSNRIQHQAEYGGQFENVDGEWHDLSVCDIEDFILLADHGFNSYGLLDKNTDCEQIDCIARDCYTGCTDKYLDIYGYRDASLVGTQYKHDDCRAVRITEYPFGISRFNPDSWEIICIPKYDASSHPGDAADPRVWKDIPLVLFFSEFCDPQDFKSKRFIELYSPNKRNFKIKNDLVVMKWEGTSLSFSFDFMSLKDKTINENGFLVLCINWYLWDEQTCNVQTGYSGIANSGGDNHFALAECEHPNPNVDCNFIDVFGFPGSGISASGKDQDFSNGRAYRYEFFHPVARKIFDIEQWAVSSKATADTCDPGSIDPTAKPPFSSPPNPAPIRSGKKPKKSNKRLR